MTARNGKPRESALFREPRYRVVIEVGTCATEEQAERIIEQAVDLLAVSSIQSLRGVKFVESDGTLIPFTQLAKQFRPVVPLRRDMFAIQRA